MSEKGAFVVSYYGQGAGGDNRDQPLSEALRTVTTENGSD
jgi:hypothetical protein